MGMPDATRRIASAAAYGGGGLSVLGASLYALLRAEAKVARKAIGVIDHRVPDATGWYGRGRPGPAIKVALLGDSSAAGYGVDRVEDTPGARLGAAVAAAADRRVHLREFAVVGAESSNLDAQVDAALPVEPDLAVILIGANDVTHSVPPRVAVRHLTRAVHRLQDADIAVVVGTCPDLGTVRPIPPPLRQVAKMWSRRLAAMQTIAVVEAGGRTVSLASILGPEFAAAPAVLFGPDRFHPSAAGYASLAGVLVPSVMAALGLAPEDEGEPEALRGEGVLPVDFAAREASRHAGTEVGGTQVGGQDRSARGRWAMLMRRRQHAPTDAEAPGEEPEEAATVG